MKEQLKRALDDIFKINVAVKQTERVLILSDGYNKSISEIGTALASSGEKFSHFLEFVQFQPTGCHGTEPPEEIWQKAFGIRTVQSLKEEKLLEPLLTKKITDEKIGIVESIIRKNRNERVDVVIALSYFSTSHTKFRDLLCRICGTRYASMPLFDEKMLSGPMQVDWKRMEKRTEEMAALVNRYNEIIIETPQGTRMVFSKQNRTARADTGIITKPGAFSNLPAGEVYLAPLEGTAEGKLVLEWAPTRKLKSPVTLNIQKGMVYSVEGDEPFVRELEDKLSEQTENRNIAELGIGTNDRASRPDNILESEKISGTIHIALGDNSSFGGTVRTSFHQDFVFFEPTVTLIPGKGDRRVLLKRGQIRNL